MTADLRLGDWRDVLADVECDALITDPPYSERTHQAQCCDIVAQAKGFSELGYKSFSPADAAALVHGFKGRVRGWWVIFSDHELQRTYEEALASIGLYVFAPLPQVTYGRSPRLAGDGPASWTTWITVARPRNRKFLDLRWGSLPGAYLDSKSQRKPGNVVIGAKQLHTMEALVRDYSKPGDLICDPCAGGATTALAAIGLGRRFVGAEIDPDTHAKAMKRLSGGYQMELLA